MPLTIIGLGNPGEQYKSTRHNAGRMFIEHLQEKAGEFTDWKAESKDVALVAKGELGGKKTVLVAPETFMNNSGKAVRLLFPAKGKGEQFIVAHDDLDLPFGAFKISYARGSGGHKGIESIIRAVRTNEFVRFRFGISPTTPKGKPKKPDTEKKVLDFILGKFTPEQQKKLNALFKHGTEAAALIANGELGKAMSQYNVSA